MGELVPVVVEAEIVEEPVSRDPVPIDLDEVIDAEVVERPPWRSPLDGGGHCLHGGVVTDPDEVEAIGARIAYAQLPIYRRWFAARPAGWRA
jgi:hypothetical protein